MNPRTFQPLSMIFLALALATGLALPTPAQETSTVDPAGSARLLFEGKQVATVGFSLRGDGPRFALSPVARALGVELRIGPLGDAHTLVFDKKTVLLGPDDPAVVTLGPDGKPDGEIFRLSRIPIRTARGLQVPLEFLQRVLGDELGYEVEWRFDGLELILKRRELRQLRGSINLVHQYRISTVEIVFSERPRFRFETLDDGAEVRLVGDSLALAQSFEPPTDPLVRDLVLDPTRIRIELAPDAVAGEPRLVPRGEQTSMVIEIFRRRGGSPPTTPGAAIAESLDTAADEGLRKIVLDPGHGGPETGALGQKGAVESKLTLAMARLLKTRLEQRLPVQVELTRETDVDIPLDSRVALANQVKADLFISLHFNSYRGSRARGAETYFLSRDASDQLAAQLAERENASSAATPPTDASGDLSLILWDLAQSHHLSESRRFAGIVQEELNQALGMRDRGVRQAPFRVLMGADMPAVLVELGFLSNPEEEAKVLNPAYQVELADALVRAVARFRTQMDPPRAGASGRSSADELPTTGGRP